jgi:acyl-CoA thioesterase FadM
MFMAAAQLMAVLAAARAPRVGVFEPVRVELRAWPWLCDALGHINNARYLDLADLGRGAWLARTGVLTRAFRERYAFLVAGTSIAYRREIPLLASFALDTQVVGYDERWLSFSATFLVRQDGAERVAARAIVRGQVRGSSGAVSPFTLLRDLAATPGGSPVQSKDVATAWQAQDSLVAMIRDLDDASR